MSYAGLWEISWGFLVALMCLFQNTSQSTSKKLYSSLFKMEYMRVYLHLFLLNNGFITFICLASPQQSLASPSNYRHVLKLGNHCRKDAYFHQSQWQGHVIIIDSNVLMFVNTSTQLTQKTKCYYNNLWLPSLAIAMIMIQTDGERSREI